MCGRTPVVQQAPCCGRGGLPPCLSTTTTCAPRLGPNDPPPRLAPTTHPKTLDLDNVTASVLVGSQGVLTFDNMIIQVGGRSEPLSNPLQTRFECVSSTGLSPRCRHHGPLPQPSALLAALRP